MSLIRTKYVIYICYYYMNIHFQIQTGVIDIVWVKNLYIICRNSIKV